MVTWQATGTHRTWRTRRCCWTWLPLVRTEVTPEVRLRRTLTPCATSGSTSSSSSCPSASSSTASPSPCTGTFAFMFTFKFFSCLLNVPVSILSCRHSPSPVFLSNSLFSFARPSCFLGHIHRRLRGCLRSVFQADPFNKDAAACRSHSAVLAWRCHGCCRHCRRCCCRGWHKTPSPLLPFIKLWHTMETHLLITWGLEHGSVTSTPAQCPCCSCCVSSTHPCSMQLLVYTSLE